MTFLSRRTAFWALWVAVFALPWQGTMLLPGIGTVSRSAGLVAAGAGIAAWTLGGRRAPLADGLVPLVLLAGWSVVSIAWTSDVDGTIDYVTTVAQLALLAVLLWDLTDSDVDVRRLMWAWVLGSYVGAVGVVSAVATISAERATAFGFNENDLGSILALAVPIAWYLGVRARRPLSRLVAWGYLLVGTVAVLSTASRGASLVLVAGAAVLPLAARTAPLRRRIAIGTALVVIGGLMLTVVPDAAQDRLGSVAAEVRGGDLNDRTPLWSTAVDILSERPLLGTAAGAADVDVADRVGYASGVHNTYLSVAMQLGVVGLGLFLLALLVAALRLRPLVGPERVIGQVLLGALVIAMVPLHWELQKVVWVALALLAALVDHAATGDDVDRTAPVTPLVRSGARVEV